MVCFGASKIGMSKTSELGPVDPQIVISNDKGQAVSVHAAHEIIESYEDLLRKRTRLRAAWSLTFSNWPDLMRKTSEELDLRKRFRPA